MKPAATMVLNERDGVSGGLETEDSDGNQDFEIDYDTFGDMITKKDYNMLRIGFLNVGGLKDKNSNYKDDALRTGLTCNEYDIFGLGETNLDWPHIQEQDKLYHRSKEWWESSHVSYSHNCSGPPRLKQQWGGTALLSCNKAVHRIIGKGIDNTKLGRWCWTRFHGQHSKTIRIFSAYCPNYPTGAFSFYSQHSLYYSLKGDPRCPRVAFVEDLGNAIMEAQQKGDRNVVLLDGNMDMRNSHITNAFLR
jgi:hypothetical protein